MDSILFTGGADWCENTELPVSLSLLKRKAFGSVKSEERTSGKNVPRYSEKVLIGNWAEERVVCRPPIEEWKTVYKTNYKPPPAVKDLTEDLYTIWKNKERVQATGRKPPSDGDAFFNNMTTTYDLSYRILRKDFCGPRIRRYNARKELWVPEVDLSLSYGNQTNYGIAEAIEYAEKEFKDSFDQQHVSLYQIDYTKPSIAPENFNEKRFPKPRGDMNTPDLRHLGIILSPTSTSKSPAREPQLRSSRCQRLCTNL